MNPGLLWLICYLAVCGVIAGIIIAGFNFDRIAVAFLCLVNAPIYEEARRLATLIYQHPEQWKMTSHTLTHAKVGEVWSGLGCDSSLHVEGEGFGRWDPNFIERRIIYNAIAWYRRFYIKHLLTQVLNAPALNVPAPAG
jgi:hypothetical protein